jgi:hypothetical protein
MGKEHLDEQENLCMGFPGEMTARKHKKWGDLPRFLGYIVLRY